MSYRAWRLLVAASWLIAVLAGCSGAATAMPSSIPASAAETTSTPTAGPTPAEEATPTPTASPSGPIDYGLSRLVFGSEDCEMDPMLVGPTWSNDLMHGRNAEFVCTVEANDSRVAGTAHYTWNLDRWGTSDIHGSQVQWGTIRIENEGGAWEAEYVGVYTSATGDVGAVDFTGSGDYAGLSYYRWSFETFGSSWPTKGLIYPAVSAP
jgi:hypothetical protein